MNDIKTIVFVLSSDKINYPMLEKTQRETWGSVETPGIDVYFYKASDRNAIEGDVIHIKHKESAYYLYKKTMKAFEIALTFDWDFMLRADNSTYVHKEELKKTIGSLPKKPTYAGMYFYNKDRGGPIQLMNNFIWGEGMILSRDVVTLLVENQFENDGVDDIMIGRILKPFVGSKNIPFVIYDSQDDVDTSSYVYRCKKTMVNAGIGISTEKDIDDTIANMRKLHSILTNKNNGKENRSDQNGRKEIHKASWSSCEDQSFETKVQQELPESL